MMVYDIGYTGRVSVVARSKREASAKVETLVNTALNFDPSATCSAFVISRKEAEEDDSDELDSG